MKFSSVLFMSLIVLVMSTVMIMSCNNWISIWVCLELNMFMFIPIIMWNSNSYEEEGAVKYFIVQSLASALLLFSVFYSYSLSSFHVVVMFLFLMSVFMKIGSFPFIFWYTSVMKSISWISCMILSTWQKLGPLVVLIFYMNSFHNLFMMISLVNVFIGGCAGCTQSDLRTLLAYSSISHMGWMMSVLSSVFKVLSMLYFILYSVLVIPIFIIMMYTNMKSLSMLFSLNKTSSSFMVAVMLLILSLSGMPPLSGFMPKLMILSVLVSHSFLMSLLMVVFSLFSLYMYLNMFFTIFMYYYVNMEFKMNFDSLSLMSVMLSFGLVPMVMIYI
nr:NADH dehydrogenase subunit 2 [Hirudo nipponia]